MVKAEQKGVEIVEDRRRRKPQTPQPKTETPIGNRNTREENGKKREEQEQEKTDGNH